jgi:hypothetical protein
VTVSKAPELTDRPLLEMGVPVSKAQGLIVLQIDTSLQVGVAVSRLATYRWTLH